MANFKLQDRERRMVIMGGIAAVAIIGYLVGEGPYEAYRDSGQKLEQAQSRLKQAQRIHDRVIENRNKQALLKEKLVVKPGFDLLNFVYDAVQNGGLSARANIDNNSRATTGSTDLASVRVGLRGVSLAELVDFLHHIYDSGNLVVLHDLDQIGPSSDKKGLDCEMVFVAPRA